jgi:hypothetical protein
MKPDGVLTTYSTSLPTRLALYENNFFIYLLHHQTLRSSSVASLEPLNCLQEVNMEHKIKCNPHIKPIFDSEIS